MSFNVNKALARKYYEAAKRKKKGVGVFDPTPTPSKADALPNFREAIPTPNDLDNDGCHALAAAIIAKTAEDYWKVCDHDPSKPEFRQDENGNDIIGVDALRTRHMIEMFVNESCLFDALTNIDRNVFLKEIRAMKLNGKPIPSIENVVPKNRIINEVDNWNPELRNNKFDFSNNNYYPPYINERDKGVRK